MKGATRGTADGGRPGADGGRAGGRGAALLVAEAAGVHRPAVPGAPGLRAGAPGAGPGGAGDRGDRAAEAAEVDGARGRARGDVLGFHRAAADDHRGVRVAVPADV